MESESAGYTLFGIDILISLAMLLVAGLVFVLGISALKLPGTPSKVGGAIVSLFAMFYGASLIIGLFRLISGAAFR